MAASANHPQTFLVGLGAVSSANTARDGSGTIVTLTGFTVPSAGARLKKIVVKSTADPADSVLTLFVSLDGGATWKLFDEIDLGNPAAGSTTVPADRVERSYADVELPSGCALGAAVTVAPTAGVLNVWAFGDGF